MSNKKFSVGDKVKVVHKFERTPVGKRLFGWSQKMDETIGEVYTVAADTTDEHGTYGLDNGWYYLPESLELVEEDIAEQEPTPNKYSREIKQGVFVDVYDVLRAFNVTDPCLQHLLKKALAAGCRGHKTEKEDLQDILASAKRALELYEEWEGREEEF